MGAAAENRYKAFAARQDLPISGNAVLMRDLNAVPKRDGARAPFGDIHFVPGHGGWWAECPTTGYGYWYRTIREAVSAWRVAVFIDGAHIVGQPF